MARWVSALDIRCCIIVRLHPGFWRACLVGPRYVAHEMGNEK